MLKNRKLTTGYEIAVAAARDVGAKMMYGYPITPTCEIFSTWINSGMPYLQTEDEIASGFCVCGAALAGQKAFTDTAGPGHVLMQDALSMAEGMRIPFVAIVGMRGGPSSGTVIYSQQEVTLACYGGNGEGLRLVYSPSNLEELYHLTVKAFNDAWKYRFPAIVLTDGYLLKNKGVIDGIKKKKIVPSKPMVISGKNVHLPSIYTLEEELYTVLIKNKKEYDKASESISDCEIYNIDKADTIVIAHGIVGASAKQAVQELKTKNKEIGLFRPITLRPFAKDKFNSLVKRKKKLIIVESSLGQLEKIVRDNLDSQINIKIETMQYPGLGIEPEAIINKIN